MIFVPKIAQFMRKWANTW